MWKSAYVGIYQLLNWRMHGETWNLLTDFVTIKICLMPDFKEMYSGLVECSTAFTVNSYQAFGAVWCIHLQEF